MPIERLGFEAHLRRHARANRAAKARIARAAMSLPRNAESVYLDEGSTVQLLAEGLSPERPLTVVTNSLPAATLLGDRPGVQVIVLGGHLRAKTMATLDHWATGMLADLVLDLAIMGTNGVSPSTGSPAPTQPWPPLSAQRWLPRADVSCLPTTPSWAPTRSVASELSRTSSGWSPTVGPRPATSAPSATQR